MHIKWQSFPFRVNLTIRGSILSENLSGQDKGKKGEKDEEVLVTV